MNCGHCGSDHGQVDVAKGTIERREGEHSGFNGTSYWEKFAMVQRCPRCGGLTLYTYDWGDWYDPEDSTFTVLYPRTRSLSGVPTQVRMQYDKALQVKSIDLDFYIIGLRRVIEVICLDKSIKTDNLQAALKKLVNAANLPDVLERMVENLRLLGNRGAHVNEAKLVEADAEAASDFVDVILEYLYVAPAKLKRVEDGLARRDTANKEP